MFNVANYCMSACFRKYRYRMYCSYQHVQNYRKYDNGQFKEHFITYVGVPHRPPQAPSLPPSSQELSTRDAPDTVFAGYPVKAGYRISGEGQIPDIRPDTWLDKL
jgi:hypothetical protein